MQFTTEQLAVFKAHVLSNADVDIAAARDSRNDTELARLYNEPSSFVVWRSAIDPSEYREAMVWTEVDNLAIGKARIWEWITQNMSMAIDATQDNVRAGLAEVFPANGATRGALLAIAKENASLVESVFATGTGTNNSPGTRVLVGNVTIQNIGEALN